MVDPKPEWESSRFLIQPSLLMRALFEKAFHRRQNVRPAWPRTSCSLVNDGWALLLDNQH